MTKGCENFLLITYSLQKMQCITCYLYYVATLCCYWLLAGWNCKSWFLSVGLEQPGLATEIFILPTSLLQQTQPSVLIVTTGESRQVQTERPPTPLTKSRDWS